MTIVWDMERIPFGHTKYTRLLCCKRNKYQGRLVIQVPNVSTSYATSWTTPPASRIFFSARAETQRALTMTGSCGMRPLPRTLP